MFNSEKTIVSRQSKRAIAILVSSTLALVGLTGISSPAYAGTNVDVFYSGNSIGTPTPSSITVDRDVVPLLAASSVTGSRTNYNFGGWSLTAGGEALTGSTYRFSSTATRLDLYAVWNTVVNYSTNGADSGSPAGNTASETYRLGQTLTLPTVGTMVKSGYAFGGWMPTTVSTTRSTTYTAAAGALGAPTLYAAWIKTVSFNANISTSGTIPGAQVYVAGGTALKLPVVSELTLRKTGYEFAGWSTSATGTPVTNPGSYVPLVAQQTLYAIWRVQSTKATARVFFKPGKSVLRAAQKLVIRDMVDSLRGKSAIKISLAATRARSNAKSLGKARNTAVVNYLKSLGVVATYSRTNTVGKGNLSTALKNNRVTISASWTNPIS
jgi:uncharacterized repeat protein (TIGR02543 family)